MDSHTFTSAYIYGGVTHIEDPEEINELACILTSFSEKLIDAASAYAQCYSYAHNQLAVLSNCVAPTHIHTYDIKTARLLQDSDQLRTVLTDIADRTRNITDNLERSLDIYSHAEAETSRILQSLVTLAMGISPLPMALALSGWSISQEASSNRGSFQGFLTNNAQAQQSVLQGIGDNVSQGNGIPGAAQALSPVARMARTVYQGKSLEVNPITVHKPLPQSHSLSDSLSNLERLSIGQPGNSYATISIQRYTHSDNTHSWIVTIPGTDGHKDSPFGWAQNINLMASHASTRAQAESQQAVLQAMTQAGIKETDEVALIGHSQGGIVAASIASDKTVPYKISHVVTAGSPVANHPIDTQKTWVTSIETDHELVSNLDGKNNPSHPHWLTIRGKITDSPSAAQSSHVPFSTPKHELSHGMNYHVATYRNALELDSDGLNEHNEHFRKFTEGKMDENLYFTCRIYE
ncbi:alpha/beta hydrolase [Alloscardovia theropitheci]|nr:alpha/beta hydrolase [Alloscardovia theropitheci]